MGYRIYDLVDDTTNEVLGTGTAGELHDKFPFMKVCYFSQSINSCALVHKKYRVVLKGETNKKPVKEPTLESVIRMLKIYSNTTYRGNIEEILPKLKEVYPNLTYRKSVYDKRSYILEI